MPLTFNTAPYYDDYDPIKEFYKILVRPGYAVQARELNQLQSIFGEQLNRFGQYIFQNGAMVTPGQITYDQNLSYVIVNPTYNSAPVDWDLIDPLVSGGTNDTIITLTSITGAYVQGELVVGATSNATGIVVLYSASTKLLVLNSVVGTFAASETLTGQTSITTATSVAIFTATSNILLEGATTGIVAQVIEVARDINTIYIKYVNSGTNNTTTSFADGEIINILPPGVGICSSISTNSTGLTAQASIADGVYFIFGMFLNVVSQTIRLADYNQFPTVNVGLEAVETIITPEEDPTLNDNALGTPNYAAPGAHRYKIVLNLVALPISTTPDAEFTSLMVISNGVIQTKVQQTALSEIMSTLAERTYDANGDFIVNPFGFDLHENLFVDNGDGTNNGGIYTTLQGGQESELALGIEPGKAYVDGYEIQTISKQYINLNKARNTNFFPNSHTRAYLGNYVFINRLFGLPYYDTCPTVTLYGTPIVTDGVAPLTSSIGTATIRGLQFQEGSFEIIGDPGPIFQCFLADINITTPGVSLTDIRSFAVNDGTITTTANVLTQVDIVNVIGNFDQFVQLQMEHIQKPYMLGIQLIIYY